MIVFLSIMVGSSAAFFVYLFAKAVEQESWKAKWFTTLQQTPREDLFLAWNRHFIPLPSPLFKRSFFKGLIPILDPILKQSGLGNTLSPYDFLSWSFWLMIEFTIFSTLLFGFSLTSALSGGIVGLMYPLFWISFKRRQRISNIRRDLPLVMDLLAISVTAGLDMMQAIQRIVKHLPRTELLKELGLMLQDLKLGYTRKEALTRLKERIPLLEIRSLVSLLLQAIQLGTPLAPVLLASADQMRTQRFLQAERAGIKASNKILFPLIFCILPAVFLTIFAPLLIRYFTGGFENFL